RTIMLPARTDCPPNFLTPRRLLSLSRPLRDEPPAFLCAMTGYFAFGVFLAAALAGAAFFVDGFSAFGLAAADFFAAGFGAFAASALPGAGFSVGVPTTSLAACWSAVVSTVSFARAVADLPASAFALGSAVGAGLASALGTAFLSAL